MTINTLIKLLQYVHPEKRSLYHTAYPSTTVSRPSWSPSLLVHCYRLDTNQSPLYGTSPQ